MGKHTDEHGVSKYRQAGPYRVHLPVGASARAKELYDQVVARLDQMKAIQVDALEMLTVADAVLNSAELLKRSRVRERLELLFMMPEGKLDEAALQTMREVLVRTRAGLERDGQVKFKRLTAEEDEAATTTRAGWAYGATSMYRTKEAEARGYLMSDKRGFQIRSTEATIRDAEFADEEDPKAAEEAFMKVWGAKLEALKKQHERDLERDKKWKTGKFEEHTKHETLYAGRLKLDMFTFVHRMNAGEHALVSRTLVHEATHRYAGTFDHTYIAGDGSVRKSVTSGETHETITQEHLLENADSYAFFAYAMWAAKRDNNNFGD